MDRAGSDMLEDFTVRVKKSNFKANASRFACSRWDEVDRGPILERVLTPPCVALTTGWWGPFALTLVDPVNNDNSVNMEFWSTSNLNPSHTLGTITFVQIAATTNVPGWREALFRVHKEPFFVSFFLASASFPPSLAQSLLSSKPSSTANPPRQQRPAADERLEHPDYPPI